MLAVGRTAWMGFRSIANPLPTHNTNAEITRINNHAPYEIQTHDLSVRARLNITRSDRATNAITLISLMQ
jgi:hypothetical protein